MCMIVCAHVRVYARTCMCVRACVCARMCVCAYVHACLCVFEFVCERKSDQSPPNRVSSKDEIQNQLYPTFIFPSESAQNLDIQSGTSIGLRVLLLMVVAAKDV